MPSVRISKDLKSGMYFLTFTVLEWINIFTSENYFSLLLDTLKFYVKNKNLKVIAFVVMTNHIHLIVESNDVIEFVKSFKSFTTKKIGDLIKFDSRKYILNLLNNSFSRKKKGTFQLWMKSNYPEYIENVEFLKQKINYIHNNPVKKGYVVKPEDWKYSSAGAYCGKEAIIDIYFQDLI